jgi:hypothetical protein
LRVTDKPVEASAAEVVETLARTERIERPRDRSDRAPSEVDMLKEIPKEAARSV